MSELDRWDDAEAEKTLKTLTSYLWRFILKCPVCASSILSSLSLCPGHRKKSPSVYWNINSKHTVAAPPLTNRPIKYYYLLKQTCILLYCWMMCVVSMETFCTSCVLMPTVISMKRIERCCKTTLISRFLEQSAVQVNNKERITVSGTCSSSAGQFQFVVRAAFAFQQMLAASQHLCDRVEPCGPLLCAHKPPPHLPLLSVFLHILLPLNIFSLVWNVSELAVLRDVERPTVISRQGKCWWVNKSYKQQQKCKNTLFKNKYLYPTGQFRCLG